MLLQGCSLQVVQRAGKCAKGEGDLKSGWEEKTPPPSHHQGIEAPSPPGGPKLGCPAATGATCLPAAHSSLGSRGRGGGSPAPAPAPRFGAYSPRRKVKKGEKVCGFAGNFPTMRRPPPLAPPSSGFENFGVLKGPYFSSRPSFLILLPAWEFSTPLFWGDGCLSGCTLLFPWLVHPAQEELASQIVP